MPDASEQRVASEEPSIGRARVSREARSGAEGEEVRLAAGIMGAAARQDHGCGLLNPVDACYIRSAGAGRWARTVMPTIVMTVPCVPRGAGSGLRARRATGAVDRHDAAGVLDFVGPVS